jgi:polysaccharide export outer membrane protein
MPQRIKDIIIVIAIAFTLTSCYHNKHLVYLQDKSLRKGSEVVVDNKLSDYRLQPSDIISVQVRGAGEDLASNVFNVAPLQGTPYATPGNLFLEGYSISSGGAITMPVLGELHVKGLTIEEARAFITSRAEKYLRSPVVLIKLTNFKVTVLGEVKNPGYYYVYNERVTILEALGLAGDLTTFGDREQLKLIRQQDGKSRTVMINLTDPNLLSSNYFYLMPGDVLYVQPLAARAKRTNLEVMNVVFGGLTTIVLIMSFIASQN